MKNPRNTLLICSLAALAAVPTLSAQSSRKNDAAPVIRIDVIEAELGPAKDHFESFRTLKFAGYGFYNTTQESMRVQHQLIYEKIRANTLAERLDVSQSREFITRLLAIGAATHDGTSTTDGLTALSGDIDSAIASTTDGDKLTTELDRREWLMDEVIRFASDGGKSTTAMSREIEALISAESRKKSGTLSERDRAELLDKSVEAWRGIVLALAQQA
jgi:hypothetical protein